MRVEIRNLGATFGPFVALRDIDLVVEPGHLLTLLGPSGCGKTTLLRSVAGIVRPSGGDVLFDGRRMNDVPVEKRNIGMVFQTYALFPHMTIYRNLAFGLEMRQVPKALAHERIMRALDLVELRHLAERYPRQLSGGQQQRVALARAIVIEPDILLFDEPLSNLDAKLRESLREDLKALQRHLGITSIYVTHDQAEAMALADHIVVMRAGTIVEEGAPQALYRRPRERYVAEFLGHTNVVEAQVRRDGSLLLPWGAARPASEDTPPPSGADKVLASLRPEDIGISTALDGLPQDESPATIQDVTFLGATIQYKAQVDGLTLRIHVTGESAELLEQGTAVRLMPPKTLHVLKDTAANAAHRAGVAA